MKIRHRWKWNDPDLHYASPVDYYRRNVVAWAWSAFWLPYSVTLLFMDGRGWWLLFWSALAVFNLLILAMPYRTYKRVIVKHMASDREFLTNLENKGIPSPVAQEMLNILEDESLAPGHALYRMHEVHHRWLGLPPDS